VWEKRLRMNVIVDVHGTNVNMRVSEDPIEGIQTRSEFLARHGVFVLRLWNHQVRQELNSVLRAIWFALEERQKNNPSPSSSPFGKGRGEVHVPSLE